MSCFDDDPIADKEIDREEYEAYEKEKNALSRRDNLIKNCLPLMSDINPDIREEGIKIAQRSFDAAIREVTFFVINNAAKVHTVDENGGVAGTLISQEELLNFLEYLNKENI